MGLHESDITSSLLQLTAGHFHTALADPPYEFDNATGKVAPEHRRLHRYHTMSLADDMCLIIRRGGNLSRGRLGYLASIYIQIGGQIQ
jgi:tRNA1(Val) A37 N6-methylase TrmN6